MSCVPFVYSFIPTLQGMDQHKTRLVKPAEISKGTESLPFLKTHILGVKVHGQFTNVFIDYGQIPHDSNLSIHAIMCTLKYLLREGKLGRNLLLQADNTSK